MYSFNGGYRLTTGMKLTDIVFHYSLNCREQSVEGDVSSDFGRCLGHKVFLIVFSDFTISESESDLTEQYLTGILSCLSHDLV